MLSKINIEFFIFETLLYRYPQAPCLIANVYPMYVLNAISMLPNKSVNNILNSLLNLYIS